MASDAICGIDIRCKTKMLMNHLKFYSSLFFAHLLQVRNPIDVRLALGLLQHLQV